METTYWLKQTAGSPLFPDILWSRPETKQGAGKLLIVGGNSFGFSAPGAAYAEAVAAAIGTARVLLPENLRKVVGNHILEAEFAPTNPSGSFSAQSLEPLLTNAQWADCVLLAGELGRNSETAMTLESFVNKYTGLLTITRDAADYFLHDPKVVLDRKNTLLVISFEQLQKIAIHVHHIDPLMFSIDAGHLAHWLHEFTAMHAAGVVTMHSGLLFMSSKGSVVSQAKKDDDKVWRVKTAARASVFWLQNSEKQFEAVVSSWV